MLKKTMGLIVACTAILIAVAPLFSAAGGDVQLIPRRILFGNPVKAAPRISPCGTRLAYLAPSDKGVLNVWVRTIGKEDDVQVTHDTHRGIRIHFWAQDGKRLFYLQDLGGDENWHVYSVDLESRVVRDLTPFQGVRASNVMTDKKFPGQMLVGLNLRDRRVFDMYRIDLSTGAITLDTRNPGDVLGWVTDPQFQIRACQAQNPRDASTIVRVRDSRDAPWRDLVVLPFGENGGVVDFCADGRSLLFVTSMGADTARLVRIDAATGKELETIAADSRADLGNVFIQPDTKKVQAVAFNYLRNEWRVLDPAVKEDFATLSKLGRGEFYVSGRDHADKKWLVTYQVDDGPVSYHIYDRAARKAEQLFVNRPELAKYTLARMKPVVIPARDGYRLVSYLTLPVGAKARNLPLVLNVHGGPWARDRWGYNPEAQWFANRGYACLQVNFRGSAGFGKKFLHAGDKQWGVGGMQHDLTDAVKWAVAQGIADPERICIYGGSYGGYATLAGLVFTPQLYACGVDIVGPSNLKTLLASIPPYWAPMKKRMILMVGDVENDADFNRKISPLFHAENIRVPLIVAQGANDPRVNIREADQIVAALRARNLPVTYVVYTDEGHGFARPQNRLDFYGRVDEFLAEHLGGRSEPWRKIEGSSAEVR